MESITKNRQSAAALRAMVARAYGPDEVCDGEDWAGELGNGCFNVVYRIRLRSGTQAVLKIAPPPDVEVLTYERGAMATELAALRLVREHTKVPVPEVEFADRSQEVCDAAYFFMSYVDGDDLHTLRDTLTDAEKEAYDERLGAITRELNSIPGPAFGPLTGPGTRTWRPAFLRMVDELLRDGERRGIALPCGYDLIRGLVAAHADALDEVTEPRFVEWDLWSGNCMVRDGRVVAIVDHERAFYGDPLMEFGFAGCESSAFGDSTAFLRGYGHPPLTEPERIRRRLYNLHLALVLCIETTYRAYSDDGHYDWACGHLRETVALLGG
ncbi:aminoglycoside phosphotransferase family protein [Streptomyces sp. TRM66268-LWL]|uniref:Aminoglycoside phosphotransferase family protein n=1 Tax=Streptomyces polyasparticus TaxID=2767826 RepID=A0ABR7SB97_9ACTN|nr:aminoglycoside phosphotransferase family protein [Streptomyces polyasparticus]MBC9712761.1 aminoglycoside phosphotransferase family protein [Streptomyces polyasparticus]